MSFITAIMSFIIAIMSFIIAIMSFIIVIMSFIIAILIFQPPQGDVHLRCPPAPQRPYRSYVGSQGRPHGALTRIGLDPKFVGGKLGILAVLHTWTRALEHHRHAHMLVPAGGLDKDGVWRESRKKFLVPVRALSKLFRARFMKLARRALPRGKLSARGLGT